MASGHDSWPRHDRWTWSPTSRVRRLNHDDRSGYWCSPKTPRRSQRRGEQPEPSWSCCLGQDNTNYAARTAQREHESYREAIHGRGKGLVRPREPRLLKRFLPSPNLAVHFSTYRHTMLSSRPLSSRRLIKLRYAVLSELVGCTRCRDFYCLRPAR